MATKKMKKKKTGSEKVVPKGDVLPLDELLAMADVTEADVERAKRTWRRGAPKGAKRLLDAESAKPKPKPNG